MAKTIRFRFNSGTNSGGMLLNVSLLVSAIIISAAILARFASAELPVALANCDSAQPYSEDCLLTYAENLQLDKNRFKACLSGRAYEESVKSFSADAKSLGIDSLPAVFIGTGSFDLKGFVLPGEPTEEMLRLIISHSGETIESVQQYVITYQQEQLTALEKSLLEYYVSPQGGSRSAEEARTIVAEVLQDERSNLAATGLLQNLQVSQGPFYGAGQLSIVVFATYECASCKQFMQQRLPLIESAASQNNVRYVFRDMALPQYSKAAYLGNAAYCAGEQGQFFAFHARLFE